MNADFECTKFLRASIKSRNRCRIMYSWDYLYHCRQRVLHRDSFGIYYRKFSIYITEASSVSDLFERSLSPREHRFPVYLQNRSLSVIQLSPYGKSARWSLQESIKVSPTVCSIVQSRRFTYIHKHERRERGGFTENRIVIQNQHVKRHYQTADLNYLHI